MLERQPGIVDWIEDLVFTGLLFAAATQLLNDIRTRRGAARLSRSAAPPIELTDVRR